MLKDGDRMRVIRGVPPEVHLRLSEIGRQLNVDLRFRYAEDLPSLRPGASSFEAVPGQPRPTFIYRHHEAEDRAVRFLRACGLTAGRQGNFTAVGETAWKFLLEQVPRVQAARWSVGGLENLLTYRVSLEPPSIAGRVRPDDTTAPAGRRRDETTATAGRLPPDDTTAGRRPDDTTAPAASGTPERWWLELEVAWGDQRLPAAKIREALVAGRRLVQLPDGSYAWIPDRLAAPLEGLFSGLVESGGRLRVDRARVPLVTSLIEEASIDADTTWQSFTARLRAFERIEPTRLPKTLRATLRPYQEQGVHWLAFLRDYGLGGILADDMGLGKTVMVLALRLAEQEAAVPGAWLVVAPSSVVYNWEAEVRRFAPSLRTLVLAGAQRHRLEADIAAADLVITSYALLRRDVDLHLKQRYRYLVLDEAQHIKNPSSQTAKAARRLRASHRLALTGTPIENRLEELWSQFSFLMPQLLGSLEAFKLRYILPIEQLQDAGRQDELRRRVRPFILRRLKEEVARDLPPRTDAVTWCEMTGIQRRLYNAVLRGSRRQVFDAVDARGMARARLTVLSALLRLRQVCCDPHLLRRVEGLGEEAEALLDEYVRQHDAHPHAAHPDRTVPQGPAADPPSPHVAQPVRKTPQGPAADLPSPHLAHGAHRSAKMQLFHELLQEIVDGGHRVLVFSQFVTMLELLRAEVERAGLAYEYLDGSTRDRMARVDRFNAGTAPVFLISLKAGGTGLNLTGADYVIHYDPWWNPAVEAQATDRAHRIGQTRPVFSYKLIARGTVEERMLELQERKRVLAEGILDVERGVMRGLTREDLEFLLSE